MYVSTRQNSIPTTAPVSSSRSSEGWKAPRTGRSEWSFHARFILTNHGDTFYVDKRLHGSTEAGGPTAPFGCIRALYLKKQQPIRDNNNRPLKRTGKVDAAAGILDLALIILQSPPTASRARPQPRQQIRNCRLAEPGVLVDDGESIELLAEPETLIKYRRPLATIPDTIAYRQPTHSLFYYY